MSLGGRRVNIPIVVLKVLLPGPNLWPQLFTPVCMPLLDSLHDNTTNWCPPYQIEYIQERLLVNVPPLDHTFLRWARGDTLTLRLSLLGMRPVGWPEAY